MTDRLATGVAWMVGKLIGFAPVTCQYTRGGQSEELDMRRSPQPTQAIELDGRIIEWEPVDFLVATDDLPFGEPEDNDRITCTVGNTTIVHGVYSPGTSRVSHDLSSAMTRIRTKVVN